MKMINCKGTILVEAVISTVIIAISLTLIMQSLLSSYKGLNVQKDYTKVLGILENNLAQLLSGVSNNDQTDFSDDAVSLEHNSMDTGENLKKEVFNARWETGKQQRQVYLTTFIYNAPHDQTQKDPS